MGVAKPTGEYADEMLDPGGWPEIDEQSLYDRGQTLTNTLQQVTTAIEGFQHEETEVFGGGIWSGGAASSAQGKLGEVVSDLQGVQNDLVKAITWYQRAADTVAQTKSAIADRVEQAQSKISDLEDDTDSDSDDIQNEIDSLVQQVHGDNVGDVSGAAAKVPTSASWKPPTDALHHLLSQKTPPPVDPGAQSPTLNGPNASNGHNDAFAKPADFVPPPGPAGPVPGGPGTHNDPFAKPADFVPPPGPAGPVSGGPGTHNDPVAEPAAFQPTGPVPAPAAPMGMQPPGSPRALINQTFSAPPLNGLNAPGGGGGLGTPMSSLMSSGFGGQAQPNPLGGLDAKALDGLKTADAGQAGPGQGMAQSPPTNAPIAAAAQAAASAAAANAAMVAPAAAQGPPVTSEAQAAAAAGSAVGGVSGGHGGGAGGVGGALGLASATSDASASSGSSMPLLPPATPHQAAPVSSTGGGGAPGAANTGSGSGGPGVHPASTTSVGRPGFSGSAMSSQAEAAPAPIPVSSARAQKDAIADATRRQPGGGDVQVAYRLAAALNARDMVNKADFRFFWMTAVTADGQIVVANSYGLAFIPEGVNLPAQVIMASADDTVPVDERARWATYPNLALQGWAAHHNTTLRIVIAKREHFAGIDPGVPTHFVTDEDIPASGSMQGRSRLDVVAPEQASRLASVSDLGLVDMLPPAPVDASPPPDQRTALWWELMKHLMSSDPERGVAHLQSFAAYASHCQELALHRAHSAVHAVEQRQAVAEWLYWQHLHGVLSDALAGSTAA